MCLLVVAVECEIVKFKTSAAMSVASRMAPTKQQKKHNNKHVLLKAGQFLNEIIEFRKEKNINSLFSLSHLLLTR
jgi:hypothetical protein